MGRYAKFIVAVLGAIVTTALTIWTHGDVENWLVLASAALTAITVYGVPNTNSNGTNVLDSPNGN